MRISEQSGFGSGCLRTARRRRYSGCCDRMRPQENAHQIWVAAN